MDGVGQIEGTTQAGLVAGKGISVVGPAGGERSAVDIRRAELEGGSVTLMPLDQLQAVAKNLDQTTNAIRAECSNLAEQSRAPLGEAGSMLADRWQDWPSQPFYDLIRRLLWLQGQERDLNMQIASFQHKEYRGFGGLFERKRDSRQVNELRVQLAPISRELGELSVQLAQGAPPTGILEIEQVREPGAALLQQSQELAKQANRNAEAGAALAEEISRRREAVGQLGFDALYLAAKAETDGLDPIASPLMTKRGEQAYFVSPARLARMARSTRYLGGSQGFSFPIGRTGIRYRVGSYSGRPVSTESLKTIDSGSLVISNQRFAFLGSQKSVAFPLTKIIQVQGYRDGVAVSREGRENVDFYQGVNSVGEMLFYINWFTRESDA